MNDDWSYRWLCCNCQCQWVELLNRVTVEKLFFNGRNVFWNCLAERVFCFVNELALISYSVVFSFLLCRSTTYVIPNISVSITASSSGKIAPKAIVLCWPQPIIVMYSAVPIGLFCNRHNRHRNLFVHFLANPFSTFHDFPTARSQIVRSVAGTEHPSKSSKLCKIYLDAGENGIRSRNFSLIRPTVVDFVAGWQKKAAHNDMCLNWMVLALNLRGQINGFDLLKPAVR